ncbi:MAG: agaA 4 [Mucilaginibacter sp.]|nr:agaA 4 [Mucilaginibacter sp.]
MKKLLFAFLLIYAGNIYAQKFEGLALTPPMGWNSWNTFAVNINEDLVMGIADKMVSSGMKDAGYNYLVLDDAWMAKERDNQGNLVTDPKKFPHGIKAVADYVHAKGLKFGLYNCAGTKTCAGYPGTRGYEYQDARQYAAWGVDYLKFDWCNTEGINAKEAYTTMSKAIKAAGRPMIFSLCEWGSNKPWEWAAPVGQLWRTTSDITNLFSGVKKINNWEPFSVMRIIELQNAIRKYAGPDHWNDPDMLEVGNGMTRNEDRAHFSMWCMLAAPLIAGNDLRKMTPQTTEILTNKEVIAVDQDSLGVEGYKYAEKDSVETWIKPLKGGLAICFLNRSLKPQAIEFKWADNPLHDDLSGMTVNFNTTAYKVRDVWTKKDIGKTTKTFKQEVPAHDVVMLRLYK